MGAQTAEGFRNGNGSNKQQSQVRRNKYGVDDGLCCNILMHENVKCIFFRRVLHFDGYPCKRLKYQLPYVLVNISTSEYMF
jgi:hypothetical protein